MEKKENVYPGFQIVERNIGFVIRKNEKGKMRKIYLGKGTKRLHVWGK